MSSLVLLHKTLLAIYDIDALRQATQSLIVSVLADEPAIHGIHRHRTLIKTVHVNARGVAQSEDEGTLAASHDIVLECQAGERG